MAAWPITTMTPMALPMAMASLTVAVDYAHFEAQFLQLLQGKCSISRMLRRGLQLYVEIPDLRTHPFANHSKVAIASLAVICAHTKNTYSYILDACHTTGTGVSG